MKFKRGQIFEQKTFGLNYLRNKTKLTFCVSSQNGEPVLLFTTYLTKAHDDFWGNVGAPVNISRTLPTRKLEGSENQE